MGQVRIAGTVEQEGGANEQLLVERLRSLPDDYVSICGWACPRRGREPLQVDAIVVAPRGVFVLEAKNWRGQFVGDSATWEWSGSGGTKRAPSPIEGVIKRCHALRDYLRIRLSHNAELFDGGHERLKFWVGSFVVLLNASADPSRIDDSRVGEMVFTLERINNTLFSSAFRQSWASNLATDEIETISDAIYKPMATPIVGVDFGTTNSSVAYYTDQQGVELFHVAEERVLFPSLFAIHKGRKQVGLEVENELENLDHLRFSDQLLTDGPPPINPRNVVFWVKKLIGKTYAEYSNSREEYPFDVEERPDGSLEVSLDDQRFSPQQIATEILRAVKDIGAARLGKHLEAVIPVPVRFSDRQRRALEAAAISAGFAEVHLAIDEATAAALVLAQAKNYEGTVAVYDLGGGTFDVSIVDIRNGVTNVKAIRGDETLGGYHFDLVLADYLLGKFGGRHGYAALMVDDQYTLRRELERVRKRLSTNERSSFLFRSGGSQSFQQYPVSRKDLEDATQSLIGRTLALCEEAIAAARKNGVREIDDVIMSGGMTFMPLVRNEVRQFFFGDKPTKQLWFPPNPSVVVARGAAIYAGMLMGRIPYARVGERVSPFSYGIDAVRPTYPKDKEFYMSVLIGRDEQLFDRMGRPRIFEGHSFATVLDGQNRVSHRVLQASIASNDLRLADECTSIGTFEIQIQPRPAGENGLHIAFAIDKNGILEIQYREKVNPNNQGKIRFNMLLHATHAPSAAV